MDLYAGSFVALPGLICMKFPQSTGATEDDKNAAITVKRNCIVLVCNHVLTDLRPGRLLDRTTAGAAVVANVVVVIALLGSIDYAIAAERCSAGGATGIWDRVAVAGTVITFFIRGLDETITAVPPWLTVGHVEGATQAASERTCVEALRLAGVSIEICAVTNLGTLADTIATPPTS